MPKEFTPPPAELDDTLHTYAIVNKLFKVGETGDPPQPIHERRQVLVCTLRTVRGDEIPLPGVWVHDLTNEAGLTAALAEARAGGEAQLSPNEGTIADKA
jgi:hypothetical protein